MKKFLSFLIAGTVLCALICGCAPAENLTPNQSTQQTMQPTNTPDTSSFIGEEKAKELALQAAGITAEGTMFDRVELDRENGVWVYEVEFRQGAKEYDVKIKADDGAVIGKDIDID